jgi:hypothetical protein
LRKHRKPYPLGLGSTGNEKKNEKKRRKNTKETQEMARFSSCIIEARLDLTIASKAGGTGAQTYNMGTALVSAAVEDGLVNYEVEDSSAS